MVRIVDLRAAFGGGLGHAAIIAILLFGELGPLTPPARAAGNNSQSGGVTDPIPTDGPARVVPFYAAGDTNGTSADPSISLRKDTKSERPPATRTPKKEHWTSNQRVYANPDGTMTVELGRSINFKDAAGTWQATDLALVDRGNGRIGPRSAPGATMFHTTSGDTLVASLTGLDGMLKLRALGYGPGGRSGGHLV